MVYLFARRLQATGFRLRKNEALLTGSR
jgi:hypothetical protein